MEVGGLRHTAANAQLPLTRNTSGSASCVPRHHSHAGARALPQQARSSTMSLYIPMLAPRAELNGSPRVFKALPVSGKHLATPSATPAKPLVPRLSTTNGTAASAAVEQLRICSEYKDPKRVFELRHAVYGALTLAEQYLKSIDHRIIDTARRRLASAADFNELFHISAELETELGGTGAKDDDCEAKQLAAAAAFLVQQARALKARETWFTEAAQALCLQAQAVAQKITPASAAASDLILPNFNTPKVRRAIPKPTPYKIKGIVQPVTCSLRKPAPHLFTSMPLPKLREPTQIPSLSGHKRVLPMQMRLPLSPPTTCSVLSPIQRHGPLVKPVRFQIQNMQPQITKPQGKPLKSAKPGLSLVVNRQIRC